MTSDFDLSGCNKQAESLLLTSPGMRDCKFDFARYSGQYSGSNKTGEAKDTRL